MHCTVGYHDALITVLVEAFINHYDETNNVTTALRF